MKGNYSGLWSPCMLGSGTWDMPLWDLVPKSTKQLCLHQWEGWRPRNRSRTVEIILRFSPDFSMTKNLKFDNISFFSQKPLSGVKSASSHPGQELTVLDSGFFFSVSQLLKTKQEVSVQTRPRYKFLLVPPTARCTDTCVTAPPARRTGCREESA